MRMAGLRKQTQSHREWKQMKIETILKHLKPPEDQLLRLYYTWLLDKFLKSISAGPFKSIAGVGFVGSVWSWTGFATGRTFTSVALHVNACHVSNVGNLCNLTVRKQRTLDDFSLRLVLYVYYRIYCPVSGIPVFWSLKVSQISQHLWKCN